MTAALRKNAVPAARVPASSGFAAAVRDGLMAAPKRLNCAFFYDAAGSDLFEAICAQPEYYPTRTECSILADNSAAIAERLGARVQLVEFGSGAGIKTRLLLRALDRPALYVPIDIAHDALAAASTALAKDFPDLAIRPVCADYTAAGVIPQRLADAQRVVGFFPGSTIGNLTPEQAWRFLAKARHDLGPGSAMVLGVDLKKTPAILHAAYNDAAGITARFNRNILVRINRELAADFALDRFDHYAFYNPREGRIEMHLVSALDQRVTVDGAVVDFAEGESIHTENSYKYTEAELGNLAARAGYEVTALWTDERRWFAVALLEAP